MTNATKSGRPSRNHVAQLKATKAAMKRLNISLGAKIFCMECMECMSCINCINCISI